MRLQLCSAFIVLIAALYITNFAVRWTHFTSCHRKYQSA